MKTIEVTWDIDLIKNVLVDDYESLAYDGSPSLEDFIPTGIWFILKEDKDIAGVITLAQLNNVMWSPHIFIFKDYRGPESAQWGKQVADYMKKNYGAKKFLAFTPYLAAKRLAEKIGFKHIGTLTKSILKNGELWDQHMLELE